MPSEETLTVPCHLNQLGRIGSAVRRQAEPVLGVEAAALLDLAATEVCSNVIRHGHPADERHEFTVSLRATTAAVEIEIRDAGPPFDASRRQLPSVDGDIADLPEGGFGMALVDMTMDLVECRRENDTNITRLVKRRPEAGAVVRTPEPDGDEMSVPIVDWEELRRLRYLQNDDEPDIIAELVGEFLADSAKRMLRLRAAAANGNTRGVVLEAHTLKGAAAQLSLKRLHQDAGALEQDAKTRRPEDLSAMIDRLAASLNTVSGVLLANPTASAD